MLLNLRLAVVAFAAVVVEVVAVVVVVVVVCRQFRFGLSLLVGSGLHWDVVGQQCL